jgi:uncharacterized membrane protein YdbT with pleckstrin-like domain
MPEPTEAPLWSGSPSQIVNLPVFALCFVFLWLVFPLFIALWKWLVVRCMRYELTSERLRYRHGVFNRDLDEIELYRVRDYAYAQPFWLRLFGLGNITLVTSDRSHPVFTLRAIADGEALRDRIRNAVEACKARKGVKELDVE